MLALEGKRVLDLCHLPPGALCTMILGDLGADVIKIGAPLGTSNKGAGILAQRNDDSLKKLAAFDALNRNKRSVGLNLREEHGRQVFYRLAKAADVIVEGFRPGVVKRLGVDYQVIQGLNPGIIYCSLSGYGQDGPYSSLPGHDINYISIAGALNLIGTEGQPPVIPLNLLADFAGASLHGVIGIMAALLAKGLTGKGQYVDISYTDSVITLLSAFTAGYFSLGASINRGETALSGAYPYYTVYETKDGKYLSIGCVESWFWENLCRALGKEEFKEFCCSPEHLTQRPQGSKWSEIRDAFRKIFLTKTRDEWFEYLIKNDVPVGKVYELDEVFKDPQILHRNMVVEIDDPIVGKIKHPGIAIKLSDTPGKIRRLAPVFGEHTDAVLAELGYADTEIEVLRKANIIR